jgi:hypothetical protein
VRAAIRQYVCSFQSVRKLSKPHRWTISPVNGSSAQNAEMKRTPRAAR